MSNHRQVRWGQLFAVVLTVVGFSPCCTTAVVAQVEAGKSSPTTTTMNSIGMKLVLIPAGEFVMGSPREEAERFRDEGPQHQVRITTAFLLGQYEVTQEEWEKVMDVNLSDFNPTGRQSDKVAGMNTSRFPVERVSWYDAVEFCNALSQREGLTPYYSLADVRRGDPHSKRYGNVVIEATVSIVGGTGYRLPTEAEWEYACRAGTTTPFHFGATSNGRDANVNGSSPYGTTETGPDLQRTAQVGSYAPNAFGLYDMHGNALEWCADAYDHHAYRDRIETTSDPLTWKAKPVNRVLRGGMWCGAAKFSRSAYRAGVLPYYRVNGDTFRLARTP